MAYMTEIFEWEGDSTQPFDTFNWKSKLYHEDFRVRYAYGMIHFESGDFTAYNTLVDAYNAAIELNLQYLSAGRVVFAQGPHQGWPVGGLSVAGTLLTGVGSAPSYSGTRSLTLKVYVDETLYSSTLIYDQKPFRVDAPRKSIDWEFELEGNVDKVKQMIFAPSVRELKQEPKAIER